MCEKCGEKERGCGWRKLGGYYLEGGSFTAPCGVLPAPIVPCVACGQRPKFTRALQRVTLRAALPRQRGDCPAGVETCATCPLGPGGVSKDAPIGLMWVGAQHYTPNSFLEEALRLGVSKRIPRPPRWLVAGETWVLLAHQGAVHSPCDEASPTFAQHAFNAPNCEACKGDGYIETPGVFAFFRPTRVVKIVTEAEAVLFNEPGVEPVAVDRNDPRHW